ncbi:hypothetical protein B0H10DRAFT_2437088 [Mycena sp. CBHHK59/15]|nr:hypothetical protein B0H10DRAFT_2437088 [Mycena sp. CBHHK59/15]
MLFHGIACFSPSVHASLRSAWVKHGGALTHTKQDFFRATVFFCAGPDDPWLKELLSRSIVVRHARWIAKSVAEQFPVPVSKYLLDDLFEPTKIEPEPGPRIQPEERCCLTASAPASPRPEPKSPLPPALLIKSASQPKHEEHAATKLTLKRALNSENHDDSLTEIIQRPTKRARIQPATPARVQAPPPPTNPSPLPLPSFLPPPAASFLPLPATSLIPPRPTRARFYPSPANLTPSPALPAVPLKRIDFTALRPSSAVPTVHMVSFPRPRPARACRSAVPVATAALASATTANNNNNINDIPPLCKTTDTNEPPVCALPSILPPARAAISLIPVTHRRAFWNHLFSTTPDTDAPMRTSAAALLQMPAVDACAFVVGATFRGKAFACAKVPGRYRRPAGAA